MSHIQEGLDQSPSSAKSAESEVYSNQTEGSQNGRPLFERFPMRIVTIPVHRDVPELVRNTSPEVQSLVSSHQSEASSTRISRATSHISERPLLTVPEVAVIASNSPPPSHSLLPLPLDLLAFFAEHTPPATISADDPVGDALGIVLHAVATADPLVSPSKPPRATHYREPPPTTPAPPGVDYYH